MFNCVINFGGQRCEWHHEKGFGWHHIISVLAVSVNSKSFIFQRKGMACVKLLVKSNAIMLVKLTLESWMLLVTLLIMENYLFYFHNSKVIMFMG